MTENKKEFPFSLDNRDLLALHNILYLAKGKDAEKTIKQVYSEVKRELEKRINDEKEKF